MGQIYLVSACLVGAATRYNAVAFRNRELIELVRKGRAIPVCPEQLGGLTTPRPPAEIQGGNGHDVLAGSARVINKGGEDATWAFIKGAQETLGLAQEWQVIGAILKARSPSCGTTVIHDGTFRGVLKPGPGVTAALLIEAGLMVLDENNWSDRLL